MWAVFQALGRPATSSGYQYITQTEIAAYMANFGVSLTPWELEMLRALDNVAATVAAKYKANQT